VTRATLPSRRAVGTDILVWWEVFGVCVGVEGCSIDVRMRLEFFWTYLAIYIGFIEDEQLSR